MCKSWNVDGLGLFVNGSRDFFCTPTLCMLLSLELRAIPHCPLLDELLLTLRMKPTSDFFKDVFFKEKQRREY